MKKITSFLLLLCVALMGCHTASAETIKLTTSNGLPGQLNGEQYTFESEAITAQTRLSTCVSLSSTRMDITPMRTTLSLSASLILPRRC